MQPGVWRPAVSAAFGVAIVAALWMLLQPKNRPEPQVPPVVSGEIEHESRNGKWVEQASRPMPEVRTPAPRTGISVSVRGPGGRGVSGAVVLSDSGDVEKTSTTGKATIALDATRFAVLHDHYCPKTLQLAAEARKTRSVTVTLSLGGQFRARVVNLAGHPIAGATVELALNGAPSPTTERASGRQGLKAWPLWLRNAGVDSGRISAYRRSGTTDDAGEIIISSLCAGRHVVRWHKRGYVSRWQSAEGHVYLARDVDIVPGNSRYQELQLRRLACLVIGFKNKTGLSDPVFSRLLWVSTSQADGLGGLAGSQGLAAEHARKEILGLCSDQYARCITRIAAETERSERQRGSGAQLEGGQLYAEFAGDTIAKRDVPYKWFDEFTVSDVVEVAVDKRLATGRLTVHSAAPVIARRIRAKEKSRTVARFWGADSILLAESDQENTWSSDVPVGRYEVYQTGPFLNAARIVKTLTIVEHANSTVDLLRAPAFGALNVKVIDRAGRPTNDCYIRIQGAVGRNTYYGQEEGLRLIAELGRYVLTLRDATFREIDRKEIILTEGSPIGNITLRY